jgi:hypothetical protein
MLVFIDRLFMTNFHLEVTSIIDSKMRMFWEVSMQYELLHLVVAIKHDVKAKF